jgi:hypothetical protein
MPEIIEIDCWGQVAGESDNFRVKPPVTVEIDTPANGDGFTFRRFFKECPCAVQRDSVVTEGDRTIVITQIGYGDWNDRASSMTFVDFAPTLSVYRQEITASNQTFNAITGVEISGATIAASLTYGTVADNATFSFYGTSSIPGVELSSSGVLSGRITPAGTYSAQVAIIAPHAKQKVITVKFYVSNS